MAKHYFKHRERLPYVSASTLQHEIPLGGYVSQTYLLHGGSVVVAGGTASGTSLGENPGNLISRVIVEANSAGRYPGGILKQLGPRSLIRRRNFDHGRTNLDAALTGAAGTFTLRQLYQLNWGLPMNPRSPVGTFLKTDEYIGLQLRVETGSRDTQFSGNDRTFTYSGMYVDVFDKREVMQGDQYVLLETDQFVNISGANAAFTVSELPARGNYQDLLVCAETTNQALSNGIVNRVQVNNGNELIFDQYAPEIQEQQEVWITDTAETLTGLHLIAVNPDGLLNGAVPVAGARQFVLVMDVSNPGTDRLVISNRRVIDPASFAISA